MKLCHGLSVFWFLAHVQRADSERALQNTQKLCVPWILKSYANAIECISLKVGIRESVGVAGLEHTICKCRWWDFISCQMFQFSFNIYSIIHYIHFQDLNWLTDTWAMGDIEPHWKSCGETICFMLYEHTTGTKANRTKNLPFDIDNKSVTHKSHNGLN